MTRRRKVLLIIAVIVLLPVLAVAGLAVLVQTEWAERRIEAMASARLDRQVEIEGISLRWGWPPGVVFARLRISNPPWARDPDLINAQGLYARVAVPPLFRGLVVLPYLGARQAKAGLQMDGERATWRFGRESDEPSKLILTRIYLDDGHIAFFDAGEKTDLAIDVKGSLGEEGMLRADARGAFRGEAMKASARIPGLATQHESPLRFEGEATAGKTKARAEGVLATDGTSLDFDLQLAGATLKDLNKLTGIVLPDSPPYNIRGHLKHEAQKWHFTGFKGKVGDSDLAGDVIYAKREPRPFFQANLRSELLDFDDLAPLIGAPPKTGAGETAAAHQKAKSAQRKVSDRILPDDEFGTQAWGKMDADVKLVAKRVQRPKQLPLEGLQAHLVLKDSVLRLKPLNFTMAKGRVTSDITLDPRKQPMEGLIKVEVQGLQLRQLFPELQSMQEALGTLYGRADLVGHGQSVAALLGSSDGKATFAVNGGRISALLVELLGLDVAESVMLLGRNHSQVELRCAVTGFEVKDGVANTRDFVIDTSDTIVKVDGAIDLKRERLDLETKPYPKDPSPLALRTPLYIKGPMKDPGIRPKAGPLVARAALGAALGAIAPPLAALALIETGPGKDSDCGQLLAEARQHGAVKKEG
ncbi:MAG TPA: AsmA family protein [Usitatibacter sp.]|nr:AsmA family protein [Usitatibacter sp.]